MPGFLRATVIVMTGGAIVGAGIVAMLPPAPKDWSSDSFPSLFARLQVSDPPVAPCRQQFWPNSDRACQTWTVAHREVERILSEKTDTVGTSTPTQDAGTSERNPPTVAPQSVIAPPAPPVVERDQVSPQIAAKRDEHPPERAVEAWGAIDTHLLDGETAVQVRARALRVADDKAKVARHGTDVLRGIPVASRTADGSPRVIMIRPTSRQDALYYSANSATAPLDNTQVYGVVANFFNGLGGFVPH
jgi:hypothetical protein